MDESVLDVDQVENLIKFCPTKEEMELLKVLFHLRFDSLYVCSVVGSFSQWRDC